MPKLTKRFVEGLRKEDGDQVIFDELIPGFGVRVSPSGVRSYLVQYRNSQRRSRRLTIGKHGTITTDQARDRARKILAAVLDGDDPVNDKQAFRKAPTVNDLLDRYLVEHVDAKNASSTADEVRRLVDKKIRPILGTHKVASVTSNDMQSLHRRMSGTPRQANFTLAVCSKAFALAEKWGARDASSNPCKGIERYPENERERFLTGEELVRLGATLRMATSIGLPWSNGIKPSKHHAKPENQRSIYPRVTTAAIELLLYTGCRLSEVLNLEWSRVDLVEEDIITLRKTKAGKPQYVVVNEPAHRLLQDLMPAKRCKVKWVLPSRGDVSLPLSKSAIEQAWQRIRLVAGIEDVHLHDLRHTMGTYAGQSNANAFMVRDLLRHRTLATTGRYVNRANDPTRALSDQVGLRIEAGLCGRPAGKVLAFNR